MYLDYNMNNPYYGLNDFNYGEEYAYKNINQINMYNDEIIRLNEAIELIRQSARRERR